MPDAGPVPYGHRLNDHLARYKELELQRKEPGMWLYQGKPRSYRHILAEEQWQLNLLGGIRHDFLRYLAQARPAIKRHKYFHHLNSSQAMGFNLFFPFMREGHRRMPVLLNALDLPISTTTGCFEKVFSRAEGTSFDFYLESSEGLEVFMELKLSEKEFGIADNRRYPDKYARKLKDHYLKPLSRLVKPKWIQIDTFCRHYQILRNISYLERRPDNVLLFIFPAANESLARAAGAIGEICAHGLNDRVRVVALEDLVERILSLTTDDAPTHAHFLEFRRKYVL
jgi:hypothetical protein